ncbi:MAG: putative toxin-antitoxin system toxin component, PIN family [Bacteroidales bacterium]|nr:putative toxin-antitoxin system toxin component, PIN family [Bacteroidales bacterium]
MKIFAVIDTNVIVSALISKHADSATVVVLSSIFSEDITPIYNEDILNEYATVLRRKKFNFSEEFINETISSIKDKGIHSDRINSGDILPDPKDLVFYEVALSVEESFLVTGNLKHFPKKPFIVSPAEMVEIIEATLSGNRNILSEAGARYGK